jgi:acetyltransferase-like isoleucine patch superfamily enzyme
MFKRIFNLVFYSKPFILGEKSKVHSSADISNAGGNKNDIVIGNNTHIKGELLLLGHGGQIMIGDYCHVGPNTHIWSGKLIKIGDRVLIGHNCNIFDNDIHPFDPLMRHEQFKKIITEGQPKDIKLNDQEVVIEEDVWIGANVTILKGVKIGRGAIVGANSLIVKDIPEDTIYAGNPGKYIRDIKN